MADERRYLQIELARKERAFARAYAGMTAPVYGALAPTTAAFADTLERHFGRKGRERAAVVLSDLIAQRIALCVPLRFGPESWGSTHTRSVFDLPDHLRFSLNVGAMLRDLEIQLAMEAGAEAARAAARDVQTFARR